jgi:DNA-binding XRE family transcriptional regulator
MSELEDRFDELRDSVVSAIARFESGEAPDVIFRDLRKTLEHVPAGTWPPERCIAKAQEWAERHGEPPAAINWNPAGMKATRREHLMEAWEDGEWPSLRTVIRLFGSWNAFLTEAGFTPRDGSDPARRGPGAPSGPKLERLPLWTGWTMVGGYRDRIGVSQARLAEQVGISVDYLGFIERGQQTNPSVRVVVALGLALGVGPRALIEFDVGRSTEILPEGALRRALAAEGR